MNPNEDDLNCAICGKPGEMHPGEVEAILPPEFVWLFHISGDEVACSPCIKKEMEKPR